MLRRCLVRPSIRAPLRFSCQSTVNRYYSLTSEQKPSSVSSSQASKPPGSKKWQLFAVIGLFGFTVGSWYRIIYGAPARDSFEAFELIAKEPVSSTASIFTIKPKGKLQRAEEFAQAWRTGIWNVQFKQPQLQIVRAYTPLPPTIENDDNDDDDETSTLRFLIRKDARGGEMSTYLHRLPVGSKIELRGPNIEYPVPASVKNVIFVAGGTGIAPALQVAHTMFDGLSEREKNEKSLHILWANRQREDCEGAPTNNPLPLPAKSTESGSASWGWALFGPKQEEGQVSPSTQTDIQAQAPNQIIQHLNNLKSAHNNRITVSYFIDEEKSYITSTTLEEALSTISTVVHTSDKTQPSETQIIISGPPGFITYLAGPKVWQDGEEKQGPLGGRLAQVLGKGGRDGVRVWKV